MHMKENRLVSDLLFSFGSLILFTIHINYVRMVRVNKEV